MTAFRIPASKTLVVLLVTLLAALGAAVPAARASSHQLSVFQDDGLLMNRGLTVQRQTLDELQGLGVDAVHVLVIWNRFAPDPGSRTRPSFDATNPHAYPSGNWDILDGLVREAGARGMRVLLTPTAPVPGWASQCRGTAGQVAVCKPRASDFGNFVRALGTRYSGSFADENGPVLPRVRLWSVWNEPNFPGWLSPQLERKSGRTISFAAMRYRDLFAAAATALHATGHAHDTLLAGETAPVGRHGGALSRRATAPVTFYRELFCMDRHGKRLRGRNASVRKCTHPKKLAATGVSHHPYTPSAAGSPRVKGGSTDVTIAALSRLTRVLDQGAHLRMIKHRVPVWLTEFGFQSNPPDKFVSISLSRQAEYINQSDWIAYHNSRVRSVGQYELNDDPVVSHFNTGLRRSDGRAKPSLGAYVLPIYVRRSGRSHVVVWGQVRPGGAKETVSIQRSRRRSSGFRTVRKVSVRGAGYFSKRVSGRSGYWRLVWTPAAGGDARRSRVAAIR